MSRGTVAAQTLRSEQFEFEARTSDPSTAEPGEYWIRTDQTGSNPDKIAELRRQDNSGVTACPIFAGSEESNLGADVTRGPSVVLDGGSVGFVAMTTGNGAVGSPRAVNDAGTEYLSHDELKLNAIPDTQITRTADSGSGSGDWENGIVVDVASKDIDGLKAEISANTSSLTEARIVDTGGTTLASKDISSLSSGDTFQIAYTLSASTDYRLVGDAKGSNYTYGYYGNPSYPYSGQAFDVVAGINGFNGASRTTGRFYLFNNIRNLNY